MFASQVTKEITLANGELAVVIQKLSGSSIKKAREVRTIADMQRTRHMGGEVLRVFRETDAQRTAAAASPSAATAAPAPPKTIEELKKERFESFDRDDVLTRGIRSWSSTRPLIEGITDLDEADAQAAYEAILDLSLGPVVPADAKAASEEGKEKAS
jgi:hypothetical protein